MMYLKSVENVITLGKLIGPLFLFCLPLLSILFLKTPKIRGKTLLALYGNHFASYWASEASPKLGCSIEISGDYMLVGMSIVS